MGNSLLAGTAFLRILCSTIIGLHLFARMFAGGYASLSEPALIFE